MIYEVVKAAIAGVPLLAEKVFPAGALIDEDTMPCAIYSFGRRAAERDLSGMLHHYTDVVDVHLLGLSYDELHQLYCEVEEALLALANSPTGGGEYIFGVDVISPERDAADLDLDLMRRILRATIDWCPVPE